MLALVLGLLAFRWGTRRWWLAVVAMIVSAAGLALALTQLTAALFAALGIGPW